MKTYHEFLKEGIITGHNRADPFMDELHATTESHPWEPRIRLHGNVGIEARPSTWDAHTVHLSSIISFGQKNAGEASSALKHFTGLADKHKVRLELTASPIKNAGAKDGKNLNTGQLKSWYKRHGFKEHKGRPRMTREPQ